MSSIFDAIRRSSKPSAQGRAKRHPGYNEADKLRSERAKAFAPYGAIGLLISFTQGVASLAIGLRDVSLSGYN